MTDSTNGSTAENAGKGGNVLVYVEQRGGRILPASLQLFSLAAQLVPHGGHVCAVVVGAQIGSLAETCAAHGAQRVLLADDPGLAFYGARAYTQAICDAADQVAAKTVLLATSSLGRDVGPRVAARLDGAMATDCTGVSVNDGALRITRPMYCGKCVARVELPADRVRVVSVRPNTFAMPTPQEGAAVEAETLEIVLDAIGSRETTREIVQSDAAHKDTSEADIIVSGGRAMGSEESFSILYEMADVLDGAVGASRAAVDAGYQPQDRQIGLTGRVVSPRLYIACGIDGAIQHLAGMRGSKVIVAINSKADAPIFNVATYGCVVDLFELAPLLTAEFKRLLDNGKK
jgi:electron transfer flavoprotein alpha subunit